MRTKRLLLVIPALIVVIIAGVWIAWYQTRPVYGEEFKHRSDEIEFVLYLFDTRPSNALAVLRDGLVRELARDGGLSHGYPKLARASWDNDPVCPRNYPNYTNLDRYSIQFSEDQRNRIELPVCLRTSTSAIAITILPPFPWSRPSLPTIYKDGRDAPAIAIGINTIYTNDYHIYTDRLGVNQYDMLMEALIRIGVKVFPVVGK